MSFLEEFDRKAGGEDLPESKNQEILEFADLVRSRRAAPTEEERRRVLARVRAAETRREASGGQGLRRSRWYLTRLVTAAASVAICAGLLVWARGRTADPVAEAPLIDPATGRARHAQGPVDPELVGRIIDSIKGRLPGGAVSSKKGTVASKDAPRKRDAFAGIIFPKPKAAGGEGKAAVEKRSAGDRARVIRSGGLVMLRRKGEKRWRVARRGEELAPGDWIKASNRLHSGARLLGPEGSRVTLAWGAEVRFDGKRNWRLERGRAFFDVAERKDMGGFTVSTPDGSARALGTEFLLAVSEIGKDKKRATFCWVDDGKVALKSDKGKELVLAQGKGGKLAGGGVVPASTAGDVDWLKIVESKASSDHGIGELLARAVDDKQATMQPLEIKSHDVTVTVVDQVARTFLDEVFVNNTHRRLEGVFYYTLPADAAVSEFAMYVNGVRVEGEVLEQKRARRIFEYIRRQRRDPALLEWAGGNLFKMRIFPIEPRSTKRIQLGYTQVLPRRAGKVTYTYPLVSEKLLKNPLHSLSVNFRVLSSFGLENLRSPSHKVALALGEKGMTGALAFRVGSYSPTRDFSVSYEVPKAPECAVFGNTPQAEKGNYFMLQIRPKAQISSPKTPSRILVVVDGSASAGAQDYSVASELAASVADMTAGWKYGVLRGGQKPVLFGKGLVTADRETAAKVRAWLKARPPLGATDLLATFKAAAAAIGARESVKIVYVGDGIETLGDIEGTALAEAIAGLFEGKHVEISCAAVGSTYDRLVLGKISALTGGTFVRVEGTANLHESVGQILNSFYLASLRDVRVTVDGLKAGSIYPDGPVVVNEGDTMIVLGRAGKTGRGVVRLSGLTDAGAFNKSYDVTLQADPGGNRFLPRLWAKAHIDALFALMGLGDKDGDSRLQGQIIDTSVHYQIMSPFTAFLVLESEKDYGRFGIKRQKRMWDWKGDIEGIASTTRHAGGVVAGDAKNYKMPTMPATPPPADPSSGAPASRPMPGHLADMPLGGQWWGPGRGKGGGKAGVRTMSGEFWKGKKRDSFLDDRLLMNDLDKDSRVLGREEELLGRLSGAAEKITEIPRVTATKALASRKGWAQPWPGAYGVGRGHFGRRSRMAYPYYVPAQVAPVRPAYVSPLAKSGGVVGLKIDKPLRSSTAYKRLVAGGKARLADRLNLALALEREGRFGEAARALKPVIEKMAEVPDLWLQLGALKLRAGDADGAAEAFKKALKLTPEKDRAKMRARIGELLASRSAFLESGGEYQAAARAETDPGRAAAWAAQAAQQFRNAGRGSRGRGVWEALLKKWPRSGSVLLGAGEWHYQNGANMKTAISLLRRARKSGAASGELLVKALRRAGLHQEAVITGRLTISASKSPDEIVGIMKEITSFSVNFARREIARFLEPGSSAAQRVAAARLLMNDVRLKTKANIDALEKAMRLGFPDEGRVAAFHALVGDGRRQVEIRAGKKGPASELLTPLLAAAGGPGGFPKAIAAAQAMGGAGFSEEALKAVEPLLWRRNLTAAQRLALNQILYDCLQGKKRTDEAARRLNAVFQNAADPATSLWSGGVIVREHISKKKFETAADALEKVAAVVKAASYDAGNYAQLGQLRVELFRGFKSALKDEEADKLMVRLAGKHPENAGYLSARARILAGAGKFPQAYDFLCKAVERLEKVPAAIRLRPELVRARAADRATLVGLMARIAAQDAGLRVKFLETAIARRKNEDAVLRPWTEAALVCLVSSGDDGAYRKLLASLAESEPGDPTWSRRLGAALVAAGKHAEARKAYERVFAAEPDDAQLAIALHGLCTQLKDQKAASAYRAKILDALTAQPALLAQYAQAWYNRADRREWALEAWKRVRKYGPYRRNGYAAYMAGYCAQLLSRSTEAVDLYLDSMSAEQPVYASSALSQLSSLIRNATTRAAIEKRIAALEKQKLSGARAIHLGVLRYYVANIQGKRDEAKRRLREATELQLPPGDVSSGQLLMQTMAYVAMHGEIAKYARGGGGKLWPETRRELMRRGAQILNRYGRRPEAKGLYQDLLKEPDARSNLDRAQLVNIMVNDGKVDEAVRELRKMNSGPADYNVYSAWNNVISRCQGKRQYAKAAVLALEALDKYAADPVFHSYCGYQCGNAIQYAVNRGSLDTDTKERIKEVVLSAASRYFSEADASRLPVNYHHYPYYRRGGKGGYYGRRRYNPYYYGNWYAYMWQTIDKLGLRAKVDEMAAKAGGSRDGAVVYRAAYYMQMRGKRGDAKKLYTRALSLPGANRSVIIPQLYSLCYSYLTTREAKVEALKYLDEMLEMGAYRNNHYHYFQQKVQLLYQVGRKAEARIACRDLLKSPGALRYGYGWLSNVANICQGQKDWDTAAEVWEMAIRVVRAYHRAYRSAPNYHTLSSYYAAAARCYGQAGKGEIALACYLRGLSLIPRNNQHYYRQMLRQAMQQFLKGRQIDAAVAGYEKAVKESGGVEKPQLRMAFAEAYRQAGKIEKMLYHLEIAANLLPKDKDLRKQVIAGYKRLNKKQAVIRAYLDWAKVDRANIKIYQELGDYYSRMGKKDEAMMAWATMAEVRPREASGYRAYAKRLIAARDYKRAAGALRKAVRYRPTQYVIANELAGVYRRLKQGEKIWPLWKDGEKACRQAMKAFADDPLPWLDLVRFLEAQGRTADARAMCNTIMRKRWKRFHGETVRTARQLLRRL